MDRRASRLIAIVAACVLTGLPARAAPNASVVEVANLLKPLLNPVSAGNTPGDWQSIEVAKGVRWGPGPVMMSRPSPDGNYYARPGQATLHGQPATVVASGARTMVFSIYVRDPGPPVAAQDIVDSFRQAGSSLTLMRCPAAAGGYAPKRWYRLNAPGKAAAFLYTGPLVSGGQGYTLFLADELPAMTQAEAAVYTDSCGAAPSGGAAAATSAKPQPATGQAGIVAVIEALMRPAGAPAALPWSGLPSLPVLAWKGQAPMKMSSPYDDGGKDDNPRLLEADFKTATTRMNALATGDDRVATRFYLRDGGHLPRGAVFELLTRDGYTITALRCGKPYTQMSDAFFRITGPGKQPAILYRGMHQNDGQPTETYGLRLDNVLPPLVPGQTPAVGGRCPG